jgi:hypothetical protein
LSKLPNLTYNGIWLIDLNLKKKNKTLQLKQGYHQNFNISLFHITFGKNFYNVDKIIFFQEVLQFKNVIMLCYSKQSSVRMITKVPPPLTWCFCQIIINCLSLIVTVCFLNQF